ncbi:ATP-binding protein [Allokutzneria sp. A3M-2-11 16]|uniref:AAA family ATPase n=1 Tax=Allokutzneria sp. A3M-2-11 16 TaxID=2962043 RepID=UPI0020B89023|nr:AAA family ATPase [Allokutzneria sp. A3M-2-11 16]MCP3803307.1 ATP-binding protein [Allokutzneria sp. A3M-2-11 16]
MARLIHVNGPSGVGKSTFARVYVDRHPGVLDLDIDQVVHLVGGWRDDFWKAFEAALSLAVSMAEAHLRTGHDVVMPQMLTKVEEAEDFQAAADRAGAEYHEIVLMAGKEQMIDRFASRAAGASDVHRHIDDIVVRGGGPVFLERIHDQLSAYLDARPECVVVRTDGRDPAQTYDAVLAAL